MLPRDRSQRNPIIIVMSMIEHSRYNSLRVRGIRGTFRPVSTVKFNDYSNRLNKHDRKTPTRADFSLWYKPRRRNGSITPNDPIILFMSSRRADLQRQIGKLTGNGLNPFLFHAISCRRYRSMELIIKSESKITRKPGTKFREDFREGGRSI